MQLIKVNSYLQGAHETPFQDTLKLKVYIKTSKLFKWENLLELITGISKVTEYTCICTYPQKTIRKIFQI